jgi:hypothetical protein
MLFRIVPVVLLVAGSVAAAPQAGADASRGRAEIAQRVRGAKKTLIGNVIAVRSRFERNQFGDQLIVSRVSVAVEEFLDGGAGERSAEVDVEGGTVGGLTLHVAHQVSLKPGDRAVLMLDAGPAGAYVPHHKGLGVMRVERDGRIAGTTLTLDDVRAAARAARQ